MSSMTVTISALVPTLIASLNEYPDERAEIVFEIAAELRQAGDDKAALDWLDTVVAADGFDASMARLQAAEIHFEAGRTDLAMAALDAIKDSRERDPEACALAGELLDDRGDEQGALRWFTMGASRLREQEIADARGEFGWMSPHYGILWQRHLLRERLGYPPDDLQDDLWEPPGRRSDGDGAAFPTTDEAFTDPRIDAAEVLRILTWPQRDFAIAKQRWPHLLAEATTHEQYRARLESELRDTVRRKPTKIMLVHARVDALADYAARAGGSVEDSATRRGYLAEQAGLGQVLMWPPGRNAACWCGSTAKYKKCCGGPS
jgi:hypothetical protein